MSDFDLTTKEDTFSTSSLDDLDNLTSELSEDIDLNLNDDDTLSLPDSISSPTMSDTLRETTDDDGDFLSEDNIAETTDVETTSQTSSNLISDFDMEEEYKVTTNIVKTDNLLTEEKNESSNFTSEYRSDDYKTDDFEEDVRPSNKLFAKSLQMEDELRRLHDAFEKLKNEKEQLEKVVHQKERLLVNTTLSLEEETNQLQKTKESLKRKKQIVKDLSEENKTLGDLKSLSELSTRRSENEDVRGRNNVNVLPEDRLDRIIQLENEHVIKDKNISELVKEINTLRSMVDTKDRGIEDLDRKVKQFQWKEDRAYEIECQNSELNYQVDNLNKEIKTLQQITRMKTQTIEKLNKQIEKWKDLEEDFKDLKKKMSAKDKEIKDLSFELSLAQKSNDRKEQEIDRIRGARDTVPLKSLENDKRFLQNEIRKNLDKRIQLEKTIKWQQKQIKSLEGRLNSLNVALKDTKINRLLKSKKNDSENSVISVQTSQTSSADVVPVNTFSLVQKHAETLRNRLNNMELLVSEKDTVVESLEKKVDILERSRISENKKFRRTVVDLHNQIEHLKKALSASEQEYKQRENRLKKETMNMKKKILVSKQKNRSRVSGK